MIPEIVSVLEFRKRCYHNFVSVSIQICRPPTECAIRHNRMSASGHQQQVVISGVIAIGDKHHMMVVKVARLFKILPDFVNIIGEHEKSPIQPRNL